MQKFTKRFVLFVGVGIISACSSPVSTSSMSSLDQASSSQSYSPTTQSKVSFALTDAPNKELKSVVVDIDHMEVLVAGAGKAGRLILAKGLGAVDLLQLQNGVTLPLQDIVAPAGLQIQQIRLILKEEGHFAVKTNDSVCELKTPSAQKTGVKIILTNKIQFEAGHQYNIIVDFDALKSVVVQGNGGCLLKPVLKLKSAMKIPVPDDSSDSNDGEDSTDSDSGSGDSSSDNGDTSAGEELVTTPEENSPTDDGWDYVPVIDGQQPIVTEDQLDQLL